MSRVLTVVGGPNGSGKSSFVQAMHWNSLDPDRLAASYGGGFTDIANLRAARGALQLSAEALSAGQPLIVETTLAGRQPLRLMTQARALGYRVELVFLVANQDDDTRLRIDNRVLQGGHNIPDADLRRREPRILAHLPQAVALAGRTAIYVSSSRQRDFSLEGAATGRTVQLTTLVPARVRVSLSAHLDVVLVPVIPPDHPVTARFPLSVEWTPDRMS